MFSAHRFGRGARSHRPIAVRRPLRSAMFVAFVSCIVAVVVALSATAGSYALWNGTATVSGATITAGSSAITINGGATASLAFGALGPGESAVTPLTIVNTGSTPVSLAVTGTSIGTDAASLAVAPSLTATLTQVTDPTRCVTGLTGGQTGALTGFATTAAPVSLAKNASAILCLQLTLATTAPSAVQGQSAAFTMALTGTQVAP
ncbi:MAG TPA: hypothetical protein VN045_01730 [Microbacteriaceae bacterium]|nr:hypothetical protein [Microbacteriaceae bacterium]